MAVENLNNDSANADETNRSDVEFSVDIGSIDRKQQSLNSKELYQKRMTSGRVLADRKTAIQSLYEGRLIKYEPSTKLYYRINEEIGNIEYLISANLAAGLPLSGSLANRAIQFIRSETDLFGFEEEWINRTLYIKHTLYSQLGTHCILGFRYNNDEELDKCIVIHFDQEERLVMVTSIYQPFTLRIRGDIEWNEEQIASVVNDIQRGKYYIEDGVLLTRQRAKNLGGHVHVERKWYTCYQDIEEKPCLQVKYVANDVNYVFILSPDGEIIEAQDVQAANSFKTGKVYANFWEEIEEPEILKQVVLRDLESESELSGRYAKVQDSIYFTKPQEWGPAIAKFTSKVTTPDRFMAYYHTDLAQRYFRELGLNVLDTYAHLNPLVVELGNTNQTKYLPIQQRVRFRRLNAHAVRCTDARSAHIVYHEFTHAVTDALARLRRQNAATTKDWRYKQILQAHAMDEGFADYFACSLAQRYGATHTKVGPLKFENKVVRLDAARDLSASDNLNGLAIAEVEPPVNENDTIDDSIIYEWGARWGCFVWKLRSHVGEEVADAVISHSIFFLTRWSTFGMGVMALILADRLLFSGIHETIILEQCGGALVRDWEILTNDTVSGNEQPNEPDMGLSVETSY